MSFIPSREVQLAYVSAPPADEAEDRARRASVGYGVALALGLDIGPDPAESLPAPEWSIEHEPTEG